MTIQTRIRNRLLSLMSPADFALIAPGLERCTFSRGQVLIEPGTPFQHAYFLDTGVGSIVAVSPRGEQVEAGLFGVDGFAPVEAMLGSDRSRHRVLIQVADDAWMVPVKVLTEAAELSVALRSLLLRYVETLGVQVAFTALSNAIHSVEERLARWILMCDDRVDTSGMPLTHDFIAMMLGVRRPSVTTALHVLQGNGLLRSERGCITVINRPALRNFAGDACRRWGRSWTRDLLTAKLSPCCVRGAVTKMSNA